MADEPFSIPPGAGADGGPPVVGVIYNPRSHRNRGRDLDLAGRAGLLIARPEERAEIGAALAGFAARGVDYLIINGGDGTVRDVLTAGLGVFGDSWPAIAVLPKGKTNALNVDLGAPAGWNLAGALDAIGAGRMVVRQPLVVSPAGGGEAPLVGFILGAGSYTVGIRAGQDAHRLGAFNSLAVVATAGWGVLQSLLGTDANPWRRGVGLSLRLGPEGALLPHQGAGYEGRRAILLASTLERFPGGIRLFGTLREGLKLVVLDRPSRRVMALIPLLLTGLRLADPDRRGLHYRTTDSFEMAIDDEFVLDGEVFAPGTYQVTQGPRLRFVVP